MKPTAAVVLIALSLPFGARADVALTHVTVIDVARGRAIRDSTVVVAGSRIFAVGRSGRVRIPKGARVIDGSGKYVIPGLWDMHAHTFADHAYKERWIFPLLIANGVTAVREIGTRVPFETVLRTRAAIAAGEIVGPRLAVVTSMLLDGPGGPPAMPKRALTTPDEARQAVRDYKRQGADFVKPYNLLSREVYLALMDEARLQRIPAAGHVPFSMSAAEVSDLGQVSIEHNSDLLMSCSTEEVELRKAFAAADVRARVALINRASETYSDAKARALLARFRRNRTWLCPTTVLSATAQSEEELEALPELVYIPSPLRQQWPADFARIRIDGIEGRTARAARMREFVALAQRSGVGLLAGTDEPTFYIVPGFSVHDELASFVRAGLKPLEALRTATLNPARFIGKEKELGTISAGKFADLVILDGNPLEDIANTRRIDAVIANGRYFSRDDLGALLDGVEAFAGSTRPATPR